jgi:hypothetical protein
MLREGSRQRLRVLQDFETGLVKGLRYIKT